MIYILSLLFLTVPAILFGYLDPGTGSALISLLIAGAAAAVYFLKDSFIKLFRKKDEDNQKEIATPEIAILNEGIQYWSTFKPIVESLIEKKTPFYYYTLDLNDPGLSIENDYIIPRYLGSGSVGYAKASNIKSNILLSTTPNIGTEGYPVKRPTKVTNLIHVFHSINDISMYRIGSLDFYDTVIMVGDFQEESIRIVESKRNLKKKTLITLGLPYLDELVKEMDNSLRSNDVRTVLVASSWGEKGCFKAYGPGIIKDMSDAGYRVIVRPHPQSFISEKDFIDDFKDTVTQYSGVEWDDRVSPSYAMNKSDLLISDTSSIRYDYAFLYKKPVVTLTIDVKDMPGYERDYLDEIWSDKVSEKIGVVLDKDDIGNFVEYIEKALTKYNSSEIESFRAETLSNFGIAGESIAEYLIRLTQNNNSDKA